MTGPYSRLFGGPARTRIVASLCVDGPSSRRALARRTGIDPEQTLDRIRSLERCGIVKRSRAAPWVNAFNADFPAADSIAKALHAVYARGMPQAFGPVLDGEFAASGDQHRLLFGSQSKTMVLLALATLGSASIPAIARHNLASASSTRSALLLLRKDGIVDDFVSKNKLLFRLAAGLDGFDAVNAMLRELSRCL